MSYRGEGYDQYMTRTLTGSLGGVQEGFGESDPTPITSNATGGNLTPNEAAVQIPDESLGNEKVTSLEVGKLTAGTIESQEIQLDIVNGQGHVFIAANRTDFGQTTPGFILGIDDDDDTAKFEIGDSTDSLTWDGTTLTITGTITATTGSIGGFDIGADYIRDAANSFGLASTVTGGDDVRFWAGDTYANRATADFRVTEAGALVATNATITGGDLTSSQLNNNTVDTDQIVALAVTNAKINDLAVSKLTAGTITSQAITLAIAAGTGDVKIQAGKTDFGDTTAGFILGMDDSDSDKPKFEIGDASNSLTWNGSTLTVTGTITTTSATIGGWSVGTDYIRDAAGVVGMSSAVTVADDVRFWAGDATPGSAEFRVTESGALTASSATITGVVTANTGYIGGTSGWVIAAGKITSTGLGIATTTGDATYAFWAGDDTPGNAEFRVSHAGALTATSATITGSITSTSGTIGGWSIGATALTSGTGATTVGLDSGGTNPAIYAGSATPASAPFRVTQAGALTATSATITGGDLTNSELNNDTVNTDQIVALAVTNAKINDLAVDKLTAGTITSKSITLAVTDTTGDVKIQAGKTDFGDTTAGFILGIDDSDANKAKFEIGDASNSLSWNGSTLAITGSITATTGTIGGFTLGATTLTGTNLVLDSGNQEIRLGSGNDIITLDAADATYRLAIGHATLASAPFRVTKAGAVTASDATVTGTFRTSSSATRAEITSDEIRLYGESELYGVGQEAILIRLNEYSINWGELSPDTGAQEYSGGVTKTSTTYAAGALRHNMKFHGYNTQLFGSLAVIAEFDNASGGFYVKQNGTDVITVDGTATSSNITIGDRHIIPLTDNAYNLGSSTKAWDILYATEISTSGSLSLTINPGGAGNVDMTASVIPTTDSTYDLGTVAKAWSTLYVDNITAITGNDLNINIPTGKSMIIDNSMIPDADNTIDLGTSALNWKIVYAHQINSTGANSLHLEADGNDITCGVSIIPDVDNTHNCGASGSRWAAVWAGNGTIQTSDIRRKKNIRPIVHGLPFIESLNPVTFQMVDEERDRDGMIAQEIQKIVPEFVYGDEEGGYALNYAEFVPALLKAVQELSARVKELEKEKK